MDYLLYSILGVYGLYIYYLAVMTLYRAKLSGLIKPGTRQSVLVASVVLPGVFLDWLANMTIASALFLEAPGSWRELVTGRLKRHCGKQTWRGRMATWICQQLLDTFDPTGRHC